MYKKISWIVIVLVLVLVLVVPVSAAPADAKEKSVIRFATFNGSLNRNNAGDLLTDLSTPDNVQAKTVAEIIQRTQPDVLLINEFDFY
jgi:uncharacterized protein YpuA (DUF1002 family)